MPTKKKPFPFIPDSCDKIRSYIGAGEDIFDWDSAAVFGKLPLNVSVTKGENLFPRIDVKKELELLAEVMPSSASHQEKPKSEESSVVSLLDIEDFAKVRLISAKVLECEPVPKADKLLKFKLDDGTGCRQIVSGIAKWYQPSDLIGKNIVLVSNLKPAKLRGVESQGMLLAADVGDRASVIFLPDEVVPGSHIH